MNTSNITNYKPKDFAELLGVSVKTLQRWEYVIMRCIVISITGRLLLCRCLKVK